jgi:phage major head subunit gpT-like protein
MSTLGKIIKILDPQAGKLQETVLEEKPENAALFEQAINPNGRRVSLEEASSTADFPQLLLSGVRSIAFDRYMATPTTYQAICDLLPSDKQREDWIEENALGELPIVHEGTPIPEAKQSLDRTLQIANYKRELILAVTEEMIKFNKTNLIKRQAAQLGRAAANTREQAVYSVLNTAGNYNRNSTTSDNDIGANTAATQFSAAGLNTAMTTLRTMKDRKSGVYFGVQPNLLIVAPRLEMAAKQLLLSPMLAGMGDTDAILVYGTGTANPFRGQVNTIIVSPRLGTSYQWVLLEAKQAVVFQEVEGFQLWQESAGRIEHEGWFRYDSVRYKARDWFGVGMLNDRFAYFSSDTSGPTVA